jgi:6-phosphogluconolactonase|eukprot:evm.model.NODE_2465_length_7346_cov_43.009529.2
MSAKLVVATDTEALKTVIAEHVAESAKVAIAERGRYTLTLSGGSMPGLLGGLTGVSGVDWTHVYVLFSDERCVSLDDADSNYKACSDALLSKLSIPAGNILTIDPTLGSADAMAQAYETKLKVLLPSPGGIPQLDTVLLGLGPDGHTASLFPDHPLLGETSKFVAGIEDSPKPPPARITLTFPVLHAAREVLFIGAGAAKAQLFQEAFSVPALTAGGKQQPSAVLDAGVMSHSIVSVRSDLPYPAFQVRPATENLWYYTDTAGASLLPDNLKTVVTRKATTGFL